MSPKDRTDLADQLRLLKVMQGDEKKLGAVLSTQFLPLVDFNLLVAIEDTVVLKGGPYSGHEVCF